MASRRAAGGGAGAEPGGGPGLERPVGRRLGGSPRGRRLAGPVEDLTRAVAHDLQEPLQLVTRYARLIDQRYRDRLDDEGARFLGHLAASAERMQSMIDDLHDVLRLGRRRARARRSTSTPPSTRPWQRSPGRSRSPARAIDRDPLPTVTADRPQMVRLLQNLIGNAIKFRGDETPRIHLSAARRDGGWAISVRDNGIGIAETDRERIFGMFQRLHTAGEIPGTGVGLAVCRRIAEGHGGTLSVESTPGAGSTFTLTLPQADPLLPPDSRRARHER